jgi:glutathione S-transferase
LAPARQSRGGRQAVLGAIADTTLTAGAGEAGRLKKFAKGLAMIVLYCFGPLWGLPDPSPFVVKTAVQLKMSGLPFRTDKSRPPEAPKGKLPFIEDNGVRIGDSVFIREHLERKYGVDLDAGLDTRQRALGWAVEKVVEDHLYWATVYCRWAVKENFDKGPAIFFGDAPPEVLEAARARMLDVLHAQGFGRHALPEVASLAARSFASLSELLSDGPNLAGETMGGADATLFAGLSAVLTPHFDTPVRDALLKHRNLVAYSERMMQRFYRAPATPQPATV